MHSGRSVKPLHLLLCSFSPATSPRHPNSPQFHSQTLEAHWNLFTLTKLSADELSVNESDADGVSFTENKHELQNWKRKNAQGKITVPNENCLECYYYYYFYFGSIFPSIPLPSFNLFPICLQRWHFQSFGDLGNTSWETTEAGNWWEAVIQDVYRHFSVSTGPLGMLVRNDSGMLQGCPSFLARQIQMWQHIRMENSMSFRVRLTQVGILEMHILAMCP